MHQSAKMVQFLFLSSLMCEEAFRNWHFEQTCENFIKKAASTIQNMLQLQVDYQPVISGHTRPWFYTLFSFMHGGQHTERKKQKAKLMLTKAKIVWSSFIMIMFISLFMGTKMEFNLNVPCWLLKFLINLWIELKSATERKNLENLSSWLQVAAWWLQDINRSCAVKVRRQNVKEAHLKNETLL